MRVKHSLVHPPHTVEGLEVAGRLGHLHAVDEKMAVRTDGPREHLMVGGGGCMCVFVCLCSLDGGTRSTAGEHWQGNRCALGVAHKKRSLSENADGAQVEHRYNRPANKRRRIECPSLCTSSLQMAVCV